MEHVREERRQEEQMTLRKLQEEYEQKRENYENYELWKKLWKQKEEDRIRTKWEEKEPRRTIRKKWSA